MSDQRDDQAAWEACPAGELEHVQERVLVRERRAQRKKAVTAAGFLVVALLAASPFVFWSRPSATPTIAGISCQEVHTLAAQYFDGKLDPELHARVDRHCAKCSMCDAHYRNFEKQQTGFSGDQDAEIASTVGPGAELTSGNFTSPKPYQSLAGDIDPVAVMTASLR